MAMESLDGKRYEVGAIHHDLVPTEAERLRSYFKRWSDLAIYPCTVTTVKPSGRASKVPACTEGAGRNPAWGTPDTIRESDGSFSLPYEIKSPPSENNTRQLELLAETMKQVELYAKRTWDGFSVWPSAAFRYPSQRAFELSDRASKLPDDVKKSDHAGPANEEHNRVRQVADDLLAGKIVKPARDMLRDSLDKADKSAESNKGFPSRALRFGANRDSFDSVVRNYWTVVE